MTRKIKNVLYDGYIGPVVDWISNLEGDWPSYRARTTQEEFKRACKIHHELHKLDQEYSPLDYETWDRPKENNRKTKYYHAPQIHVFDAIATGICGYQSVLTCHEAMDPEGGGVRQNMALFDADSRQVGIDNRASGCISDHRKVKISLVP